MALFIIPATHSALTGRWRLIEPMHELQRSIEYREVPEQRSCDRTRPVACDRTPSVSDQLIACSNGWDDRTRTVRKTAASDQ